MQTIPARIIHWKSTCKDTCTVYVILSLIAPSTHVSVRLVPALWLCAETCQNLQIPRLWLQKRACSMITLWEPYIAKTTHTALTNLWRRCSAVHNIHWDGRWLLNWISFSGENWKSVAGMWKSLLEYNICVNWAPFALSVLMWKRLFAFIPSSVHVSLHKRLPFLTLSLPGRHQGIAAYWQDKSNST